jgi:hypothetical protein
MKFAADAALAFVEANVALAFVYSAIRRGKWSKKTSTSL